jgi:metal-sulfur cluster biosynthetic enzyme
LCNIDKSVPLKFIYSLGMIYIVKISVEFRDICEVKLNTRQCYSFIKVRR